MDGVLLQMAPRELVLNKKRYHQLDHLLMKAGLFTQFLTEQMQAAENETNKAVPAAAPKRKGSKATGRSSKRQKTEQNKPQNPTQVGSERSMTGCWLQYQAPPVYSTTCSACLCCMDFAS